jgi:hypothetical protein
VVTIGLAEVRPVFDELLAVSSTETIPIGWSDTYEVYSYRSAFEDGFHIGLPHLRRFPIFGRKNSEAAVAQLFRGL